jgi:hypothetical protein
VGERGDGEHRGQRQQREAAAVEEGRELAGLPEHQPDRGQAEDPGALDQPPRLRRDPGMQAPARPDHRQRRADEQLERPRVGAVIDARGVERGAVEDGHQDARGERRGEGGEGEPRPRPGGPLQLWHEAQAAHQQEGPGDVELLLDRERPEVVERRGRREAGEVGDVVEDQPPVVEVAGGAQRGGAEVGRLVRADQRHPGHHHGEHQEEAGEQAAGAGSPERLQPDPAFVHLVEQDVGDQVAAEGEEHTHAEQPAFGPAEFEVVEDHADHRDRAQPVEARHVAIGSLYRFRHRESP